jgi:hypothetical protein
MKKSFLPQKSDAVAKNIRPNCMTSGMVAKTMPINAMSTFRARIIRGRATPRMPDAKECMTWIDRQILT